MKLRARNCPKILLCLAMFGIALFAQSNFGASMQKGTLDRFYSSVTFDSMNSLAKVKAEPSRRRPASDIAERVRYLIATQLGRPESEVPNEAEFVEDLGADDLDLVEIIMGLEDEFGISIPDEEALKIRTVQLAIDYCVSHQKQ